ncbi:hypothetical protein MNV49_004962 [Pseudohyphozyma bogoriensis]|nr:hypothetical protein MNV49_004962 [Pseudohyphozyma bogoriensis]
MRDSARSTTLTAALSEVKLDPQEEEKNELVLYAIETSLSDYGLSVHKSNGLLTKMKESKDGYVHIQHLLLMGPVSALAKTQVEVQKALRSRPSPLLTLSESGFQCKRTVTPDYDRLETMTLEDWEPMMLYVENPPTGATKSTTPSSLSSTLATLLSTDIQRVVFPLLYDPSRPPSDEDIAGTQAEAFVKAQGLKRNPLPAGGGPFRGFAFVIVPNKDEAGRILEQWKWEKDEGKGKEVKHSAEEKVDDNEMQTEEDQSKKGLEQQARETGFRTLPITTFNTLKSEYLTYQKQIQALAAVTNRRNNRRRSPSPSRNSHSEAQSLKRWERKLDPEDARRDRDRERRRPKSSPDKDKNKPSSPPLSVEVELDPVEAVDVKGAFPKGCILWVRNLHERSTKGGLKSLFSDLLNEIEEGSGRGVEFVDFEKGLDNGHLRFASAHLASLMHEHLLANHLFQPTPSTIVPVNSEPPSSASKNAMSTDPPKAITTQLLEGVRERLYWESLPEAARRSARKNAAGPVLLGSATKKVRGAEELKALEEKERDAEREAELFREAERKLKEEKERIQRESEENGKKRKALLVEEEDSRPRKKPVK